MRIGVGLSIPELATRGGRFSPASLFTAGTVGAWYDPSDYSTLFQDSAGTTPVTAVEQPVRLMLDKSQGLVLGPELWGTPTLSGTSWSWDGSTLTGLGVTTGTATSDASVAGRTYRVTFRVGSAGSGLFQVRIGDTFLATLAGGANTTYTYIAQAVTTVGLRFTSSGGTTGTISNISVRELPGNHALAPNDASRPVLRARYNLMTYSTMAGAVAGTPGTAPTGWTAFASGTAGISATASIGDSNFSITSYSANVSSRHFIYTPATTTVPANQTWEFSFVSLSNPDGLQVQQVIAAQTIPAGATTALTLNGVVSGGTDVFAASDVIGIRVTTGATAGTCEIRVGVGATGARAGSLTFGYPMFYPGVVRPKYQRIAAATDYATAGFLPYLAFDGTDDSFGTNSINFTATDKMSVCAGVTKLSDAAQGVVAELGTGAQNGSFAVMAPAGATPSYQFFSRGTANAFANVNTGYAAPITNVLTGLGDISGDSAILRANATQVGSSTVDQGTGNFGSYPLYIGRRANASLPFNGRIYQMVVCGKALSASELAALESFTNARTGAY